MPADTIPELSAEQLAEIERKYDPETAFRATGKILGFWISAALVAMSVYHFYASGFGLVRELVHRGIHLSFVLGLVFLLFGLRKSNNNMQSKVWYRFDGVPLADMMMAVLAITAAMYLPLLPATALAQRVGNPSSLDIFIGTALLFLTLEATRRSVGPTLPIIGLLFIAFAYFGPWMPGALKHGGSSWLGIINHLYMTNQGIYGIAIGVMAQYVFLFILFGVLATRIGLGQLFIDNATILAGRYTGGPAKVSVISSAFFGTISGSSVANTVSTGALTIPNMKRLGYPAHFAGGVEAASSAGGQITPPIMGAAAFIMAEFLELPYTTIIIAAIFPALLHYVGVFTVVHLMARKLDLKGLAKEQLPKLKAVWREGWANIVPLIGLLVVLFAGYTPYMSAFCGISLAVITGMSRIKEPATLVYAVAFIAFVFWKYLGGGFEFSMAMTLCIIASIATLNPQERTKIPEMASSIELAVKYALAVGAASAAVGIVVGVINTTGVGFRIGFMVTQGAGNLASDLFGFLSLGGIVEWFTVQDLQLFISLVFIATACILMGAGIPTTALYIMLVSVAQPALAQLGVPPIASHMFVLYYGVVSEITPPVCTSAYAAAAIANANPFRTGLSAFSLGLGKVVAPMAFVYAPVLLIVSSTGFDLWEFSYTATSCIAGVIALSTAVVGYWFAPMNAISRILMAIAGLVFVAPSLSADLVALIIASPVIVTQMLARRSTPSTA